jgi:hypothetical protein
MEVGYVFDKPHTVASENFNEHVEDTFDGDKQVPTGGLLVSSRRFALGSILAPTS